MPSPEGDRANTPARRRTGVFDDELTLRSSVTPATSLSSHPRLKGAPDPINRRRDERGATRSLLARRDWVVNG